MRALLVEDEIHVLEGLKSIIPWGDFQIREVVTAMNGRDGLEKFLKWSPELIVTDIIMPVMSGLEMIEKIREIDRNVPIIVLSGYDDFEYARRAIQFNVSRYILKPALHTEVAEVVGAVLEERRANRNKESMLAELQRKLQLHIPALREQFIFDMVATGKGGDLPGREMDFYQLDEAVGKGAVIANIQLYRPKDNPKTNEERDWQLLKFAASNIAKELVEPRGGFVLRYIEDRLPVVFFGPDKASVVRRAVEAVTAIIRQIEIYLDLNANAGVGRWYPSVRSYPLSMKEAALALQASDYEGYQKVFLIDETEQLMRTDHWIAYPAEQIRLLSAALVRMDGGEVRSMWDSIRRLCSEPPAPAAFVKTVACGAVCQAISAVLEHGANAPKQESMFLFLQELQNLHSASEMLERTSERLLEWLRQMEEEAGGQGQAGYVNKVLDIVKQKYRENLSFTEIARELHLSRAYLSNMFKAHTGVSFMQYLTHYRIDKARELMREGKYKVYEISEMVGYPDPSYFCRVFKNVTGQPPTEYMARLHGGAVKGTSAH